MTQLVSALCAIAQPQSDDRPGRCVALPLRGPSALVAGAFGA